MKKIEKDLIAPCGMNCAICMAYLREKNTCPGCNNKPTMSSCVRCKLRSCKKREGKYCFSCSEFPCDRLEHLDKRYREKYGMSEIKNLEFIQDKGIDQFLIAETKKWTCKTCGGLRSCHNGMCYDCKNISR